MSDQTPVRTRVIEFAERRKFDRCPICLSPDPDSKEHVPPESLGGTFMTWTCEPCNNRSGSVSEAALLDWWEDALTPIRLAHEDVPGARRAPRVLYRQTSNGEFVLVLDHGALDPVIAEKLQSGGDITMHYSLPDIRRVRLGALKSAYLAACLLLGSIPETPEAEAVRTELVAARDRRKRQPAEISQRTADLLLAKTDGPAAQGEIALVEATLGDGSAVRAISLARTLLIGWPIDDPDTPTGVATPE